MKIEISIPFGDKTQKNIKKYYNEKNSQLYMAILDEHHNDWGLLVSIIFPQTHNIIIKNKIAYFLRFLNNIADNNLNCIQKIINKIEQTSDIVLYDTSEIDIYNIIKNIYDLSDNKKWKDLFLKHLNKIIVYKKEKYHNDIVDKILYGGYDLYILLTQLFSPIYLDNNFIYSFGFVMLVLNDLYNLKNDNDNFNLNNIYFKFNSLDDILTSFNKHIEIIDKYNNIYYYKSLIYNFALWKSINCDNFIILS